MVKRYILHIFAGALITGIPLGILVYQQQLTIEKQDALIDTYKVELNSKNETLSTKIEDVLNLLGDGAKDIINHALDMTKETEIKDNGI
jgi:hypothetical protein